ncbi:hypothetical protein Tco_1243226 [Tanacetum coccineum]
MSSMKNLEDTDNFGDQFLYDKPTKDDQEKSKVVYESDSTIPDPSPLEPVTQHGSYNKPASLPEHIQFIALALRVARLEQEMSEVKKTDHICDVWLDKIQTPMTVMKMKDDDEMKKAYQLDQTTGKSAKRRRHDSGASGSAQPPTKDDEQSSKKPRESDASASKQHPTLTSTGWQITDTRDAVVDSSMHRSDPEFRTFRTIFR